MHRQLRRSKPVAVVLACISVLVVQLPTYATEASEVAQVQIAAVGADGIAGLAILAPSTSGTSAQVLAPGAPDGLVAVIHQGDCSAIDPTPVGLLGDLGGGQIQTTLPLPFANLVDGAHVVAFHLGLDLASALGCGAIPALDVRIEPDGEGPLGAGGSFTGPLFGFSISWDETWAESPSTPAEGVDQLILSDGRATLNVAAVAAFDGNAADCLLSWEQNMLDNALSGTFTEFTKLAVAADAAATDGPASVAAYRYSQPLDDGSAAQWVSHYECRSLGETAILEVILTTTPEAYAEDLVRLQALLGTLVLPGQAPDAAPTPVAPPPDASIEPVGSGGRFESPNGDFSITWDAQWAQDEEDIEEAVSLWNGASSVLISTLPVLQEDCPQFVDNLQRQRADVGGILDLQFAPEEREEEGGVLSRRSIVYTYRLQSLGDWVTTWRECRRMLDGSALSIQHSALADEYESQVPEREALLAGLSLSTGRAPDGEVTVTPQGEEQDRTDVAEPTPAEPPALDPKCAGMKEWVTDTRARLDRILELKDEALTVPPAIFIEFLAKFGGNMAAMATLQERGPIPPAAVDANDRVISMLGLLEESAVIQYELGISPSGNVTETQRSLAEALKKADKGYAMVFDLQREVLSLAGECGLPVG